MAMGFVDRSGQGHLVGLGCMAAYNIQGMFMKYGYESTYYLYNSLSIVEYSQIGLPVKIKCHDGPHVNREQKNRCYYLTTSVFFFMPAYTLEMRNVENSSLTLKCCCLMWPQVNPLHQPSSGLTHRNCKQIYIQK